MFELTDIIKKEFDKVGAKIILPRYKTVPEVDYSLFPEKERDSLKQPINTIIKYLLEDSIITDNFKKHKDREHWVRKMEKKNPGFWDFYNKNKLKINRTGTISLYVSDLFDIAKENKMDTLLKSCRIVLSITTEDYASMNLNQKLDYVHRLEDTLYKLLEVISVNRPFS